MMEVITRFRCEGCGRKSEVKGGDNGKTRPPSSWRWIEVSTFRSSPRDSDSHWVGGVVCSIACAGTAAAKSWELPK